MRTKIFTLIVVLSIAVLALSACGSKPAGPTVVQVKLSEYTIAMDVATIPTGPVQFVIENVGKEVHEVVLEKAGAKDAPFELNGKESEVEDIAPGATVTLDWTLDQPGKYELMCGLKPEPGNDIKKDHFKEGMVITFTVK